MRGADLRTVRDLLGFDVNRFSERLDVNRRTLTRWETAQWPVPDDVHSRILDDLHELDAVEADLIAAVPRDVKETTLYRCRDQKDLEKVSKRSTCVEIYNSAMGLAVRELRAQGCEVTVDWVSA